MAKRDYYQTLGVSRTASEKELRQAYHKLAKKHHPDLNPGDKQAEARFKDINEAYQVLSNPDTRKKYDQFGENWKHADRMAGAAAGAGGRGGFREGSFSWGPFQGRGGAEPLEGFDLFSDLFGRRGARAGGFAMPGQDVEEPVDVTLEEAFAGATRLLEVADGRGAMRRLEVKIPAGVRTGSRVRIAGEGGPGVGGGPKGDLWLVVNVLPHPWFERDGDNLKVDVPVPLVDAVLGGEAQVPTLRGGKLALKIPPETQNGRLFRLRGKGMPRLGGGEPGDLYARVKVVLPTNLSPHERELFQQMKELRGGQQ